jgi:DNA invertase Pin-like site-specific DNA recombinase
MRQKHQDQGLIPAVGYIRMSTDDQKDSPERQRGEIVALAQREGYQIIRWYEDHGLTGTESKNRPGFLKLMADLPKREFKTVLMYEQSRFSREDVFDAMAHWKVLKDAGVTLVTVQRGEMRFDDLAGLITALVGQHEARGESERIAKRSVSGKKVKAAKGQHMACIPFGFDREVYDETGQLVKRVAYYERFKRPKAWTSKLVPSSDPKIIDAVRYIFDAVQNGTPLNAIATELNKRGIVTSRQGAFVPSTVRRILQNPVYVGLLRYGHIQTGKFAKTGDLITVPNAHGAIIGSMQFERVKAILATSYKSRGNVAEAGAYSLSRLIFCGHCGRGMVGKKCNSSRRYQCQIRRPGIEECSEYPSILADSVEGLVLRLVAKYILCEENRELFVDALQARLLTDAEPSLEQGQLTELRLKIERAEGNLAIAESPEDFRTVSNLLKGMRSEERKLLDRIRQNSARRTPAMVMPFASAEQLALLRDNLHLADKRLLAVALWHTIERVTILDPRHGSLEFKAELYTGGPIHFEDSDLRPDRGYLRVAEYVKKVDRRVRSGELAEVLGVHAKAALHHAGKAVALGLLDYTTEGMSKIFFPKSA